jgi:hypothetical protein
MTDILWEALGLLSAFYLGRQAEAWRWRRKGDAGFPPRENETATSMASFGNLYTVRRDDRE